MPIEIDPSPFSGGPTTAFVGADGSTGIVAANAENVADATVDVVEQCMGYAIEQSGDLVANYLAAASRVPAKLNTRGTLAVEMPSLSVALRERLPESRYIDILSALAR